MGVGLVRVLAFDCSASRGSVAIVEKSGTLFAETFEIPRGRGSAFFPALERAVKAGGRIDRIAVGVGPGSYNGLRAGIAAAEGLHLALGAERVGIVSARALPGGGEDFFALGDARGGMFWLARIVDRAVVGDFELLPLDAVRARLEENPGVPRLSAAAIGDLPDVEVAWPEAEILARLAGGETPATHEMAPLYLKPAHITKPRAARQP